MTAAPPLEPEALIAAVKAISASTQPALRWKVGALCTLGDLGLDNLDRITIACALDEALNIEVPDADLAGWETVHDVVLTANRLTQVKGGTPA